MWQFDREYIYASLASGARISAIQHLSIKYLEPYLKQVIQFTTVLQIRQANYPACIQWDQARL